MSKKIDFRAVILAGGSGERFWPLSTAAKPKQFLSVFGGESLIRQSFTRLGDLVKPEGVFIITGAKMVGLTRRELPELPVANIVGEPMRRDTGAAVALGVGIAAPIALSTTQSCCRTLAVSSPASDPVIGFFPSDQLVTKPAAFRVTVKKAIALANAKDTIVTLGIKPTHPATGFGYIDPKAGTFVEKPDLVQAKQYLKKGYLWNAGMFIARASVFREAFAKFAPAIAGLSTIALPLKGLKKVYEPLPRISFDYAVMEKFSPVSVVPGDFGWDDVGSYAAFDAHYPHDKAGNVLDGNVKQVESEGNICVAKGANITVLGVKDLVIVTSGKDVLVVPKSRTGELKKLFA